MLKRKSISKNNSNKKTIRNLYGGTSYTTMAKNYLVSGVGKTKKLAMDNPGNSALVAAAIAFLGVTGNTIRNNRNFNSKLRKAEKIIENIKENDEEFNNLDEDCKNDKRFILEMIKINEGIWKFVSDDLKKDRNFVRDAKNIVPHIMHIKIDDEKSSKKSIKKSSRKSSRKSSKEE